MYLIYLVFLYVLSKYFVQFSKGHIRRGRLVTTNQSSETIIMINIDNIIIFLMFISELAEDGLYSRSS